MWKRQENRKRQKTGLDTSQRLFKCIINILKGTQLHQSSRKGKLNPKYDVMLHTSEWVKFFQRLTISSNTENVEQLEL